MKFSLEICRFMYILNREIKPVRIYIPYTWHDMRGNVLKIKRDVLHINKIMIATC